VKAGIQPVILTAFLLAHKSNVAVYKDGMFIPRLTDADIDEYLQEASRFSLRWVVIDEEKARILEWHLQHPGCGWARRRGAQPTGSRSRPSRLGVQSSRLDPAHPPTQRARQSYPRHAC
jgi:hypothetical protein